MGTNAIVGGGVPQAAGFAWSSRHAGSDAVSVTYFGDGAVNIGSVLETLNLAAAWTLPVCFFIENNQYAVSTPVGEATAEPRLSARGSAFAIPSWRVDGMDPLAVNLAMNEALAHMRAGGGPTIIEADLYRYFHQNGAYPGSAFGYRDKAEEKSWRDRDPLDLLRSHVLRRKLATAREINAFHKQIDATMREIGDTILEPLPGGKPAERRIRPAAWPETAFVDVGVRGDLSELAGSRYEEADTFSGQLAERRFIDAVSDVIGRRMETDERIVVLGEDVNRLKGGTNGATKRATDACQHLLPSGKLNPNDPRFIDREVALARCLRRHGIDVADPTPAHPDLNVGSSQKTGHAFAVALQACGLAGKPSASATP